MSQLNKKISKQNLEALSNALADIDCNPRQLKNVIETCPKLLMTEEHLKQFIIDRSHEAERETLSSAPSSDVADAQRLIELLASEQLVEHDDQFAFEVPLVLKGIANTEDHPSPQCLNNVDLGKIYNTLSLLSRGYPAEELNSDSKEFLRDVYMELRKNIDTNVAEVDPKTMGNLEPIHSALNCDKLNPLRTPIRQFCNEQ